ncbi:MAG: TonB-dependent receptor [Thermoanaerobaculales bacterium]|nr:TonB-dependent receptor [Thermoanaerobaculales bacterium]
MLNAITMSGTNDLKGQVFGYYTDDGMRTEDGRGFDANTFEQLQYGFAVGGPIVSDKVHFFVSYDGQRYTTPYEAVFRDFPVERTAEWEAITGLDYDYETGQIDQTNDADVMMFKLDWQLSDNHLLTLRDNLSTQEGENLTSSYSNTGRSSNGLEENNFNSFVASLNSVLSENAFNELILQFSAEERPRSANNMTLPETSIYSYRANWGQNAYLPNSLDEDRFQIIDNFTYYMGAHTLKAGINFDMVSFKNVFYRYYAGQYSYSSWDDFFNDEPYYYRQSFSDYDGEINFDVDYYALYLQDDWRVNPNLTLTYGLRYDLQDNPTPDVANPLYPDTAKINNDTDNFAPRVGFAWDVNGDGKSVVRGGIGMFYDTTPTLTLSNAMNDNGLRTVTIREYCNWGDCPAYGDAPWGSIGDLEGGGTPSIKVMDPDFENAETWRMSLGYEREILADFSMGFDLIYSESQKLERSQNQNIAPNGGTTPDGLPTYDTGVNHPDFDEINQYTSDVDADYKAIVLKARKRYSNGWMLDGSYTWSEARDSNSNERSTTSYPMDQYNLSSSWGPSNFDTTHKFVVSGSYQLPWDFVVSGIIYVRSGFPYSAMDGRDTNTDGESGNEFALIEGDDGSVFRYGRNTFNQPYYRKMDLRLSKIFNFGSDYSLELMLDFFNVTNEDNWWTTNNSLVNRYGEIEDDFGELNRVGDPRAYQFGVRFRF